MAYTCVVGVLAVVLAACGSKESNTPPSPSPVPFGGGSGEEGRARVALQVHRFDAPPVQLPLHKSFTLAEPGTPPLAPLRYALTSAELTHLTETSLTSRRLADRTWSKPQQLPTIQHPLALTQTPSSGSSLAVRALAGKVVGKPTPEAAQYLATWKALEERRVGVEVDDRGQLGAITFGDDPANTRSAAEIDELTQRLLAQLVPLPEEAVGVGAVWRVVTVLRHRPAIVKQTATYTLLSRTDKAWKIGVEIARVGEPQTLLDPSIPANTSLELVALFRRFKGSLTVDPTRALPTGTLDVKSTFHVHILQHKQGRAEQILEDEGKLTLRVAR